MNWYRFIGFQTRGGAMCADVIAETESMALAHAKQRYPAAAIEPSGIRLAETREAIERDYHDDVLRACRAVGNSLRDPRLAARGKPAWCMRVRPTGECIIVDNSCHDSPMVAWGANWREVWTMVQELFDGERQ